MDLPTATLEEARRLEVTVSHCIAVQRLCMEMVDEGLASERDGVAFVAKRKEQNYPEFLRAKLHKVTQEHNPS